MNKEILIKTTDLVKQYPMGENHLTALKNVNLEFRKCEFSGVVGPSGSGKTTLLNIIGTLDTPTSGSAEILGYKVEQLSHKASAKLRNQSLGFIFQTYNLFPVYTVFENVEFPLILLGMEKKKREQAVTEALEWVKLTDKAYVRPAQLSGGQAQRVAIARAIVKRPAVILADEPTANLDAENSYNILNIMQELNEQLQTTFIFATHDEKVIRYLKRIIHLNDGKVVQDEWVKQ
ncbi:lipoprotein-releasing system ATP-binding protein LolD [candidate division KSB1 bacterium]|nr:MAG: lipoprotein-releasing system ATP-binding protein LolD [candidate division KSB1 bacterium]